MSEALASNRAEGPSLDFWYEFASHYSWICARRIAAQAEAVGVAIRWRPFVLGPVFAAQGVTDSPFNLFPVKGAYAWRDIARLAADQGLSLTKPDRFPQHSLLAARLAIALPEPARPAFSVHVFAAEFEQGRALTDHDMLSEALRAAGAEPEAAFEAAGSDVVRARLRAATAEAMACGVFGAPTLIAGDGELFWGNDRLEHALAWEKRRALGGRA